MSNLAKSRLNKARQIDHQLNQSDEAIGKIDKILADIDNHRFTINVVQSQNHYSYSFGSDKFNFRKVIATLLAEIKENEQARKNQLESDLDLVMGIQTT